MLRAARYPHSEKGKWNIEHGCPPVQRNISRALASGLSTVQADKPRSILLSTIPSVDIARYGVCAIVPFIKLICWQIHCDRTDVRAISVKHYLLSAIEIDYSPKEPDMIKSIFGHRKICFQKLYFPLEIFAFLYLVMVLFKTVFFHVIEYF